MFCLATNKYAPLNKVDLNEGSEVCEWANRFWISTWWWVHLSSKAIPQTQRLLPSLWWAEVLSTKEVLLGSLLHIGDIGSRGDSWSNQQCNQEMKTLGWAMNYHSSERHSWWYHEGQVTQNQEEEQRSDHPYAEGFVQDGLQKVKQISRTRDMSLWWGVRQTFHGT